MAKYQVRVTRDLDDQDIDIEVQADSWELAKNLAVATVKAAPWRYYDSVPMPEYYVRSLDDDEDSHLIEDDE